MATGDITGTENFVKFRHVDLMYAHAQTDVLIAITLHPSPAQSKHKLECGPMPIVMAALPNIGGAVCSTPQSLPDAHYQSGVQ